MNEFVRSLADCRLPGQYGFAKDVQKRTKHRIKELRMELESTPMYVCTCMYVIDAITLRRFPTRYG